MPDDILTARLLLRAPVAADAAAIVRQLNNYNVSRHTGRVPFPYGPEDAEAFLKEAATTHASGAAAVFAIAFRREPEALIGVISAERCENDVELGYWLTEPHWGQRIMSEAAAAIVAFAFDAFSVTRLIASYQIGNEASKRILLGLGFLPIGQSMEHSRAQGRDVQVEHLELRRQP
jgi:RimJ/RimL family protein N-acetyltransferase